MGKALDCLKCVTLDEFKGWILYARRDASLMEKDKILTAFCLDCRPVYRSVQHMAGRCVRWREIFQGLRLES